MKNIFISKKGLKQSLLSIPEVFYSNKGKWKAVCDSCNLPLCNSGDVAGEHDLLLSNTHVLTYTSNNNG